MGILSVLQFEAPFFMNSFAIRLLQARAICHLKLQGEFSTGSGRAQTLTPEHLYVFSTLHALYFAHPLLEAAV